MNSSLTRLLSVIILFILFYPSAAFAKYDPKFNWHTLETPHFLYHYHDGLEDVVEEFSQYGLKIHRDVSEYFNWKPNKKTHVILSDHKDQANGLAKIFPNNTIEMYLTPPSEITALEDFMDWKYLVFKHEYTHIIQLDMAKDFPLHMRSLLGRYMFLFPHQFLPKWITEGIATHIETDKTLGTGRGQSSYFRALMRNEVKHNLRSLMKTNQAQLDWPGGTTRYLYGVYFFNFLEQEYGTEKIQEFMEDYSQFPIPFFINTVFNGVYQKTLYELWDEFQVYLQDEFKAELFEEHTSELTSERLTHTGFDTGFSQSLPNGNILAISNNNKDIKSLLILDINKGQNRTLFKASNIGSSFDIHPLNGILLPMSDWVDSSHFISDLSVININTGQRTQLTVGQRYIRATWNTSGSNIVAVKNIKGQHELHLLSKNGNFIETLWADEKDVVIGSIDFSPTHDKLLASVFRPTFGWSLEEFDLEQRSWHEITRNHYIEFQAIYSDDGEDIIYAADYSRIYNIYKLSLTDKTLSQLTDIDSAAQFPHINSESNTLYYSKLLKNGFDLHAVEYKPQVLPRKSLLFNLNVNNNEDQTSAVSNQTSTTSFIGEVEDYDAIKYLAPSWWRPILLINSEGNQLAPGLITSNSDPIRRHFYSTLLAYDVNNMSPIWNISYQYSRLTPMISVNTTQINYYPNSALFRQERGANITITWPFRKVANSWNILTSVKRLSIKYYKQSDRDTELDGFYDDLINIGVSRNTTTYTTLGVSQHSGSILSMAYEMNNFSNPEKQNNKIIFNGAFFSPIYFNTVAELGTTIISGGSKAGILYLGGGESATRNGIVIGKRNYSLKGYSNSTFTGTNLQKIHFNYHIPIIYPQRMIMSPPIGISKIKLIPYFQAARIGNYYTIDDEKWVRSIGAEINIQANFGYGHFPWSITGGIAKGVDELGKFKPYLSLIALF